MEHHLALAMPILGLGLFLVLPWTMALPLYIPLAVASALLYRQLMRDMRLTPRIGPEALVGARGTVLEMLPPGSRGTYLVRIGSERWMARASQELRPGDEAQVVSLDGMCLVLDGPSPGLSGRGASRERAAWGQSQERRGNK